ncbi:hypothetical protein BGZ81_001865 [Podila clonocystis]|nr:hypothetical protein BGZ81_001865 [Podila clonocystis]
MTTIARRCQRCLGSWVQVVSFSPRSLTTSTRSLIALRAASLFPSSTPATAHLQIRGAAFLRPSLGRELNYKTSGIGGGDDSSRLPSIATTLPIIENANNSSLQQQTSSASCADGSTPTDSQPAPAPTRPPRTHQQYKEIVLLETDFRERFIKGGGNGGQKINKTNSNVELKHFETGIVVQCQATRSLPQNRKLARRILIDRLDGYYNGEMSKRGQKAEKIREKKRRMARKALKKYHHDRADSQDEYHDLEGELDQNLLEDERGGRLSRIPEPLAPAEETIQFATLEEILASDNKKPSRRKTKK